MLGPRLEAPTLAVALLVSAMRTILTNMLFWIAVAQWVIAFPVGRTVSDLVPRVFPASVQMLLVSSVMFVVICAVFLLPLLFTGNLPLPSGEQFTPYKYGSAVGIALLIIVQVAKTRL